MPGTITVVALGGNALLRPGERGTVVEQRANLRAVCSALRPVVAEGHVAVTHGNGPQVGNELLRHERAAAEAPPLPLWLAVAQTQAEIGALIEAELSAVAHRPVACLVTHVRVEEDDPAFSQPTKPIGPFYSEHEARELERGRGWELVSESARGWRRVVPSPEPHEIVELPAIRRLLAEGTIVVACGGGGIPVARRNSHLLGVDAVIDKDRVSAVLAARLDADRLLVLTQVPALFREFGTPDAEEVRELSTAEADALLPHLPAGSMRPKLEACAAFVRATGGDALITSAEVLGDALAGRAGTRVVASERATPRAP